jgi:hypothetical protein
MLISGRKIKFKLLCCLKKKFWTKQKIIPPPPPPFKLNGRSLTPNNFEFLFYFRIVLFNLQIVCPWCCFKLKNMQYSVLSALMLILRFLLHSIISLMFFCIQSEMSIKLFPDFHIVLSSANLHLCETIFSSKSLRYILNNIGEITAAWGNPMLVLNHSPSVLFC